MKTQLIATTVILNKKDGEKAFLVEKEAFESHFITVEASENMTRLASVLEELKQTVHMDVDQLGLVELTNLKTKNLHIPMFVFETQEDQITTMDLDEHYSWESPITIKALLEPIQISGVPIFKYED